MKFCNVVTLLLATAISFSSLYGQIDHKLVPRIKSELSSMDKNFDQIYVTDHYSSRGISHTYFKQAINGIPVYNTFGSLHEKDGSNPIFINKLIDAIATKSENNIPTISVTEALISISKYMRVQDIGDLQIIESSQSAERKHTIKATSFSLSEIHAKLQYLFVGKQEVKLVWEIDVEDVRTAWWTDYFVDAHTGEVLITEDWTVECTTGKCNHDHSNKISVASHHEVNRSSTILANTYSVLEWPVESPNFGVISDVTSPWLDNAVASPNGWHTVGTNNYTHTIGNNTDTYLDDDNTNSPTGGNAARANGGANLEFMFPVDFNGDPTNYKNAAITNCFYWSNLMHDMWYNYGFDEASGNFQEENYTTNGTASDYVQSEVQDGSGTCNANFSTPSDGGNPRMQMYLCNGRDGDFDNGVIAHEYGHGISNRLTGGPAAAGCLSNQEQMGEGWSDYFGMVMTIEVGDTGPDSRGMGTWLFGEGPDGDGIRPYPYSTNFAINPMTYNTISSVSIPHGVGSVWATMLWEMTWDLIDEYGFDPDIYNGTGGNNIAMQLVMEGMKLQPCSPGFVDGRDAIIAADDLLYGGANHCLIWQSFAIRGLGYSASQGSSGSVNDGSQAFDLPPSCTVELKKTTSLTIANPGDPLVYQLKVKNYTNAIATNLLVTDTIPESTNFISASNGGTFSNGAISFPVFSLGAGDSLVLNIAIELDQDINPFMPDFNDDMECGIDKWKTATSGPSAWQVQNAVSNSGNIAWYSPDVGSPSVSTLDVTSALGLTSTSILTFTHQYDTEDDWDGGRVFISSDNGSTWTDLGPNFTQNGYNNIIYNSIPGFSGNSNGFVTSVVDLSSFDGLQCIIRFQMDCDQFVAGNGWWIDDVQITNLGVSILNTATFDNGTVKYEASANNFIKVNQDLSILQAYVNPTHVTCEGEDDGTATVIALGGSGNYSYLWDDNSTSATRLNLAPGDYQVTVSDGVSTKVRMVTVLDPPPIVLVTSSSAPTGLGSNDATATVTASGGYPFYNFLWSNGQTTSTISNLSPGMYYITVTDNKLCSVVDSVLILDPFNCDFNLASMDIQLDQYPQDISYVLKTSGGSTISSEGPFQTTGLINRAFCLVDGCYTLEIIDSFGDGLCASYSNPIGYVKLTLDGDEVLDTCDFDGGFIYTFCVPQVSNMMINEEVVEVSCNGTNDGEILSLGISGAVGTPSYLWSNGATTEAISGLSAGTYTVTVTDNLGSISKDIIVYGSNYSQVLYKQDVIKGSLRDIIITGCPNDTIVFSPNLIGDTLIIAGSPITISNSRYILGEGIGVISLDGGGTNRLFDVQAGNTLLLSGLSLNNGFATVDGGAVFNAGTLYLQNVKLEGNKEGALPKALSATPTSSIIIKENVIIMD